MSITYVHRHLSILINKTNRIPSVYYARADHFARSIKSPFSDLQVSCLGHKVSYLELFVNGLNRVNPVQAKRI